MRSVAAVLTALALSGLTAGCGSETGGSTATSPSPAVVTPTSIPTAIPPTRGEVTTQWPVTVIDDGDGPELCLGGVLDSLPPQCGGPRLIGWDWDDHPGAYEDVSGTKFGGFVVSGTFDGTDLTPTSVLAGEEYDAPAHTYDDPFVTACPEPARGWVVDASRAGLADQSRAFRVASRLDDFGHSFVDQPSLDGLGEEGAEEQALAEQQEGAVSSDIVNIFVTGDPAVAERAIREVWGGGLCVGTADHTQRSLRTIQRAMDRVPGLLSSGSSTGVVEIDLVYDDGTIAAWLDLEYGAGTVVVQSTALVDIG